MGIAAVAWWGLARVNRSTAMVQIRRTHFLGCHYLGDCLSHLVALVLEKSHFEHWPEAVE